MPLMERCCECGTVHYPQKYPSVQVNGLYFCKVSCRNQYMGADRVDQTLKDIHGLKR